jgi:plastocyanin
MSAMARAAAAAVLALAVAACGTQPGAMSSASSVVGDRDSARITAKGLAFDRQVLEVPAGRAFTIVFDNEDGAPHNVAIYRDAAAKDPVFRGDVFGGPETRTYAVPALTPGSYAFRCDVHQEMRGTITATATPTASAAASPTPSPSPAR